MASSINSSSGSSHHGPHSRPNQPPPPPPLPSVPPVPPTRDSSIAISRVANLSKHTPIPPPPPPPSSIGAQLQQSAKHSAITTPTTNNARFLSQFEPLFKPLSELPPPEPFMNKPKSYPSQKAPKTTH